MALEEAQRRNLIQRIAQPQRKKSFEFRGNNLTIQSWVNPPRPAEFILEGASETGKTYASLNLLDALARKYSNARLAMVRQYHVDIPATVWDIYKREFIETSGDVKIFGGEGALFAEYPNKSRVWVVGMDRPGKVLSGSLDAVYFNQCEESKQDGWEILSTRTTGRGGVIVPGILFGDMNPAPLTHWIYSRESSGKLQILNSTFKDNPKLYDAQGNVTTQGQETLARLSNLTGVLRARLYEGKRASTAGLVYNEVWDENDGSVTEQAGYQEGAGEIFWACDDGYSAGSAPQSAGRDLQTGYFVADAHPRVFLLCQLRPDGTLNVFAESYQCLVLTDSHISAILELPYPRPTFVSHGPGSAEFRGRIMAAQMMPMQCTEQVDTTIKELRAWLAKDSNQVRRVRVHPRCRHLRAEMLSYAYDPQTQRPIKRFDHGPDALRGLCWMLRLRRS